MFIGPSACRGTRPAPTCGPDGRGAAAPGQPKHGPAETRPRSARGAVRGALLAPGRQGEHHPRPEKAAGVMVSGHC